MKLGDAYNVRVMHSEVLDTFNYIKLDGEFIGVMHT